MADLNNMLKRAQADSIDIRQKVKNIPMMENSISSLTKDTEISIQKFVDNYPNSMTTGVEVLLNRFSQWTEILHGETVRLQARLEESKATIARLTKAASVDYSDATSRKMMQDYGNQYQVSYVTIWAKVALVVVGFVLLRKPFNIAIVLLVALVMVVVMFLWRFVMEFFSRKNPRGGSTDKGKTCADGSPSNATGSNCSTCNSDKIASDVYLACEDTNFGCCSDGLPSLDAEMKSCVAPPTCMSSTFGCCPDGLSERTDASGSHCDWTYYEGNCADTKFGCCPNGAIKQDELGSNCTPANLCGMSAFGCCSDGALRIDASGSNCS